MATSTRLAALRYRDFRLLWGGQLFSSVGSQMQIFAINWNVYRLLQGQQISLHLFNWRIGLNAQALALGSLGAVRVLPIFLFALIGGALADHHNRRSLIIFSQIAAFLGASLLALLSLGGAINLIWLYLLTAIDSAISAFDEPAQNALFPELVPAQHLPNATTLYSLLWQIGTITGPALASILIGSLTIGYVYACNAASFLLVLLAVLAIRHRETKPLEHTGELGLESIKEGWRFVSSSQLIWGSMLLDCYATFFASARTMLPLVADQVLHSGVRGYGLLATAQPVGAMLTGAIMAFGRPSKHQGPVLLLSVILYGLATAFFGISTNFVLSYILFGLTGAGDTISTIIRSTIRQQWTPASLRGRTNSIHMIAAFGGPQIGEVEAGLVAAILGVPLSIFSGGMLTVLLTGWLAFRYSKLRQYTEYQPQEAPII